MGQKPRETKVHTYKGGSYPGSKGKPSSSKQQHQAMMPEKKKKRHNSTGGEKREEEQQWTKKGHGKTRRISSLMKRRAWTAA